MKVIVMLISSRNNEKMKSLCQKSKICFFFGKKLQSHKSLKNVCEVRDENRKKEEQVSSKHSIPSAEEFDFFY